MGNLILKNRQHWLLKHAVNHLPALSAQSSLLGILDRAPLACAAGNVAQPITYELEFDG